MFAVAPWRSLSTHSKCKSITPNPLLKCSAASPATCFCDPRRNKAALIFILFFFRSAIQHLPLTLKQNDKCCFPTTMKPHWPLGPASICFCLKRLFLFFLFFFNTINCLTVFSYLCNAEPERFRFHAEFKRQDKTSVSAARERKKMKRRASQTE